MDHSERKQWENDMIEKYGYFVHFVIDDSNNFIECHSHGILVNYGHLDIQIVKSPYVKDEFISAKLIDSCINGIINHGFVFKHCERFTIDGREFICLLIPDEFGRIILRIVCSDNEGKYSCFDEDCDEEYAKQFTLTDKHNSYKLGIL